MISSSEAKALILDLVSGKSKNKPIQVLLEEAEAPRKIHRIFRRAAEALGKEIRITSKQGRMIVRIK